MHLHLDLCDVGNVTPQRHLYYEKWVRKNENKICLLITAGHFKEIQGHHIQTYIIKVQTVVVYQILLYSYFIYYTVLCTILYFNEE